MNYCSNCGEKIINNANVCIKCGFSLLNVNPNDTPSKGLALLSFFITILGVVLYIAWHNSNPKKSKSCGKGTLIGFIVSVVFFSLIFGLYVYSIIDDNQVVNNGSSIIENNHENSGRQSLGNLRNSRWLYTDINIVGYDLISIKESFEFGNGNYVFNSETDSNSISIENITEIGTFTVSGDNVFLTSSDGKERVGTIVGRSLTINGRTYR